MIRGLEAGSLGSGKLGALVRVEVGDGDPEQADISLAHVDDGHQSAVAAAAAAAAVVDEVVGSPGPEGRDGEGGRDAVEVSIERR